MKKIILLACCSFAINAWADESRVSLKDDPNRNLVIGNCVGCHSVDYIPMNSRFLDKAGWTATTNKMINVFHAPIPKEDVEAIASYLAQHYGKPPAK